MARSLPQRYYPEPSPIEPADYPRYLDQEFTRIADRFNQPPVYASVDGADVIDISPVPNTVVLGVGEDATYDTLGAWNPVTGEFTIPQTGIWQVTSTTFIEAFGIGNKTYEAELALIRDGVLVVRNIAGGADDVALSITMNSPFIADQGQLMRIELTASHENQAALAPYEYSFSYLRIGDI